MRSVQFVNLTDHPITILRDGRPLIVEPSGINARVDIRRRRLETVFANGVMIPIERPVYGGMTPLPEPEDGILYIASRTYCDRVRRHDVLRVDAKVRSRGDRILGCENLATFPEIRVAT